MIFSVLLSSLTEPILTQVVGQTSSRALGKMFKSKSKRRIMHFRYQLATFKKGSLPVADYFQKMEFADTLTAIGHPLLDCEVVSYLLAGLGSEYDSFVTSVTTRIDPMLLEDLFGHLLTFESRIEQHHSAADIGFPSANIATRGKSGYTNFSLLQKYWERIF